MKMSLVVDGLRADVAAVGELGDDIVADVAERIAGVLTRSVPGWVLDLLSEAAAELSSELPEGRVEIRVTGDDVDLAYVADEPAPAGEDDGGSVGPHHPAPHRGPEGPGRAGRGGGGRLGQHLHSAHARAWHGPTRPAQRRWQPGRDAPTWLRRHVRPES